MGHQKHHEEIDLLAALAEAMDELADLHRSYRVRGASTMSAKFDSDLKAALIQVNEVISKAHRGDYEQDNEGDPIE